MGATLAELDDESTNDASPVAVVVPWPPLFSLVATLVIRRDAVVDGVVVPLADAPEGVNLVVGGFGSLLRTISPGPFQP